MIMIGKKLLYIVNVFCLFKYIAAEFENNVCPSLWDYPTMKDNSNCWYDFAAEAKVPDIIKKTGYPFQQYKVQTIDGYILTLFRIPSLNARKEAVFMLHGIQSTSAVFVGLGKSSLAFLLADAGYDVWLGNYRGTEYSEEHIKYNITDRKFWDYGKSVKLMKIVAKITRNYIIVANKAKLSRLEYDIQIVVNNVPLEKVTEIKYLGVIIDDKLSFKNHFGYVMSKISRKVITYHQCDDCAIYDSNLHNLIQGVDDGAKIHSRCRSWEIGKIYEQSHGRKRCEHKKKFLIYNSMKNKENVIYIRLRNPQSRTYQADEIGLIDVPTMLNTVQHYSGRKSVIYVGHSLGTTAALMYASEYPEAARKIVKLFVFLSPAYKLTSIPSPYRMFFPLLKPFLSLTSSLNVVQIISRGYSRRLTKPTCLASTALMLVCLHAVNLYLGPFNQMAAETIPVYFNQLPGGTSLKTLTYVTEAAKGKFLKYDYGRGRNMIKYGSPDPPEYNITNIKVPIVIYYARNDWATPKKDAINLYKTLPKNIRYGLYEVAAENFNHFDFLFGRNVKSLVYDHLLKLLGRVSQSNVLLPESKNGEDISPKSTKN